MLPVRLFILVFMLPLVLVNYLYCSHNHSHSPDAAEHPMNGASRADPKESRTRLQAEDAKHRCVGVVKLVSWLLTPLMPLPSQGTEIPQGPAVKDKFRERRRINRIRLREEEARFYGCTCFARTWFFEKRSQNITIPTGTQEYKVVSYLCCGTVWVLGQDKGLMLPSNPPAHPAVWLLSVRQLKESTETLVPVMTSAICEHQHLLKQN